MPKGKPYSGSIDQKVATALLNSCGQLVDGALLGEALAVAAAKLKELVVRANAALDGNAFAQIVADHHAMKMGRRGQVSLLVTPQGELKLEIGYDEQQPVRPLDPGQSRKRLPLLADLRREAERLGVSVSHLGIKRREIADYLAQVRDAKPQDAKPQDAKPQDVEEDRGPMSAGPDETKVHPPTDDAPPLKRKGFVKTGDAVEVSALIIDETSERPSTALGASARRSLRQMVEASKEVDIADLLDSPTPE